MQPLIRPSDIAALLFVSAHSGEPYSQIAAGLGVSKSTAHKALSRLLKLGLVVMGSNGEMEVEAEQAIELLRVIRYVFPSDQVEKARGVMTGLAALTDASSLEYDAAPMVWPSLLGQVIGVGVTPLIRNAPDIAFRDPAMYRLLALVDALRLGDARERNLATIALQEAFAANTKHSE
jgi:DNA-binding transcriptional ArsR family regulator